MYKVVLLAFLVFLIYGVQESQQQRCSDRYCTQGSNCGCDGCCYGKNYDYGRCFGDKCYCYYTPHARSEGSSVSTTLPPPTHRWIVNGNNDGCDGCCYGLGYNYGRCYGDECYCYIAAVRGASVGTTTLPPSS